MKPEVIISVDHVSKSFNLPHEHFTGLKQALINFHLGKRYEVQKVLKDVSFEIQKGEFFGIVGRNGSGKSTLLKLLAQIYTPNSGAVHVHGSLTPFIELGVGFNPELTGRENVYLNGALLGFDRQHMDRMYDEIVEFAELTEFMDQKLKNYSSGMQVRLAFSIAIRAKSDILLIDEVLAVGDAAFQRKCFDYFMHLKQTDTTVILVTHDMGAVRQYCDRAIMIEAGEVVTAGSPEEVAQAYQKLFVADDGKDSLTPGEDSANRWGSGKALVEKARAKVSADLVSLSVTYRAKVNLPSSIFGFTVYGPSGVNILEGNTLKSKINVPSLTKGQALEMEWVMPNIFADGKYVVSVACCDKSTTDFYDWLNEAAAFTISKESITGGAVDPEIITKKVKVI